MARRGIELCRQSRANHAEVRPNFDLGCAAPQEVMNQDRKNDVPMRIKTLMLLLSGFGLSQFGYAQAQETTLHFRADPTMIDVTFDRARVSPEDVKQWMQLADFVSSENGYQVPPSRGLCRRDDPRYVG